MKTIAKNIPIKLLGVQYIADIILGMYGDSKRPAIILVDSRPDDYQGERAWDGAPLLKASTNAPKEYLYGFSPAHFTAKTYAENEGLWPQLLHLEDSDGLPLFLTTKHAVTLGFSRAPIFILGPTPAEIFDSMLLEYNQAKETFNG